MANTLVMAIYLFVDVLCYAMVIQAILSWFVRDPYSPLGKLYILISKFTEPFVMPSRKLLSRLNTGMIDFSLMLTLVMLQVAARIMSILIYAIL